MPTEKKFILYKELTPFEQQHFTTKQFSGVPYSPGLIKMALERKDFCLIPAGTCDMCGEKTFALEAGEVVYFFEYCNALLIDSSNG